MQNPVDLSNIEQIVASLYTGNDPIYIRDTQSKLQRIQRSDQAWEMAEILLKSNISACQFFGALTFTVRINSMTEEEIQSGDPEELLKRLLQWTVHHKQAGSAKYVLQKIISTLSVFFAKFPRAWPRCVESVVATIQQGFPVLSKDPIPLGETSDDDLSQGLWFCETLLQDLGNVNQAQLTKNQQITTNEILLANVPCAAMLIRRALDKGDTSSNSTSANSNTSSEANMTMILRGLDTLATWIAYFGQSQIDTTDLQPFSDYLLFYMEFPPSEDIYSSVATIIKDTYTFRPSFWPKGFKERFIQLLLNQGAKIDQSQQVDDKIMGYAGMIIAFCEVFTKQCLERDPPEFGVLMDIVVKLTGIPGTPAVDDISIAPQLLEFWTNYVEEYQNLEIVTTGHDQVLSHVVSFFWQKIRLPELDVTEDWNSDNWDEFKSFRVDFRDFLELVFPVVGRHLFDTLNSNIKALLAMDQISWEDLESCIFCLNGLSDIIGQAYQDDIRGIFESPLLSRLQECHRQRVHSTVVHMIGLYDEFFETEAGQPLITSALEYLFKSLENAKLATTASKSIYKLCNSSRKFLAQLLPDFLSVYQNMSRMPDLNSAAHERTVCAIACVIQALPENKAKAEFLNQLVSSLVLQIEQEITGGGNAANANIEKIVSLARCLVQVGKGLQVPEEYDYSVRGPEHEEAQKFWDQDEYQIRQKLLRVVQVLAIDQAPFNQQVDICEACCDIFKQGFRESLSNPFTFPGNVVVEFFQSKYHNGPPSCLGVLTDTACCFLTSSHGMPQDLQGKGHVVRTILDVFFTRSATKSEQQDSGDDPDAQTNKLKLLTQVMKHHREVLLHHENVWQMMEFTVVMLASENKFVHTESSKFWCQLVQEDFSTSITLQQVVDAALPRVCEVLVDKISGGAARSDLTSYINLIRKLVFKFPQATKQCFTQLIVDNPSSVLGRKDMAFRSGFVAKLFLTRGGPKSNEVVKDFWKECRGLADYYTV